MKPEDQNPYEPDNRSAAQPWTARKIAATLRVEPSEIVAGIEGDES